MKHDSTHKLDIACLDCVRKHIEHKEKLLEFVHKVSFGKLPHERGDLLDWLCALEDESQELLESIEADKG